MTFSRCWHRGFVRIINRWYGSELFDDILSELEHEAIVALDHDAELPAIFSNASMAKALRDVAEREGCRSREMIRAISSAVTAATWGLDDINKWAFRMSKDPVSGKWIAQGVPFNDLKGEMRR